MAIDTRQKRSSIVHMGCPWRSQLPIGDGTIGQGDRQQILGYYSGISWTELVDVYFDAPPAALTPVGAPSADARILQSPRQADGRLMPGPGNTHPSG